MAILGYLLCALAGLALGAAGAWLWLRAHGAGETAALRERATNFERRVEELKTENEGLRARADQAAALETSLQKEREAAAEKLRLLDDAQKKLREAFEALAVKSLDANNQRFLQLAQETLAGFHKTAQGDLAQRQQAIDALVKPVADSLGKFDEKLNTLDKARAAGEAALQTQLQQLARSEADLVNALRAPQTRGAWGELMLRQVVEYAGMQERCNFLEQDSTTTDAGRLRPDLVVNLPGGACVVVDAKAPLLAYMAAAAAPDEAARQRFFDEFVRLVRDHVDKLGQKSYQQEYDSPDFVVLFLPGESFFSEALRRDATLMEFARQRKVLLASPLTLIALLQTVAHGWYQSELAQNALQISEAGQDLYKRLHVFARNLAELGKRLDQAVEDYNDVVGSLERNVLPATRRLKELGAALPGQEHTVPSALEGRTRPVQRPELLEASAENRAR